MKQAINLDNDVRDVLTKATVEGNLLRLTGQLDRGLYERTNKALEALGGKWNRGKKAHVFDGDPRTAIAAAAEDGKVAHPNEHDFFPTPRATAEIACHRLGYVPGMRLLEPEVGEGDLLAPLLDWHGRPLAGDWVMYEKDPRRMAGLVRRGLGGVRMGDFMASLPAEDAPFDRILMNPPFHRGADAAHIGHALDFLAPGGRLVAIASGAFSGRATKATKVVRDRIEAWGGQIDSLPEGSFKEAGTSVATVLVTVDRPRGAS